MSPDSSLEIVGAFLAVVLAFALAAVLLRPLWLPVWRLFEGTQQFLDDWNGEPARPGREARPGAMARLQQVEAGVTEVKTVALRSEKELHPNGGTSLRDELRVVGAQVQEVQETARQATTAAGIAVNEAKVAARVALETAERREQDVAGLHQAMTGMRQQIAQEAGERYADALDLLAEHGGPDLRPHVAGHVAPHAHEVPTVEVPSMTGGPVDEQEPT